ncbi:UDP-N-acetylglucosamine 1-carboxyvinyltransferase [Loktanella sp. SALINAS62]|uniref:UDP-N-acetylglucosamine 1-carboxyvinyltransferase n=1 Tax=Loktanella sp. SALINAS62 TaxID=2706124 RepID=UPI001B8C76CC|nr:UDP-N-acetylglucosamine 1-carboxyvinyltransferase [Loktanella sp. SALINAS62]MBS1301742.1 UDP-N-acetylglucosamine 1-carboxyvinyltransferase [Loktanella sp. SALINAS62]
MDIAVAWCGVAFQAAGPMSIRRRSPFPMDTKWLKGASGLHGVDPDAIREARMTHLKVTGGKPISGSVTVSGNKNALLPMVCASLLTNDLITVSNAPKLSDIAKISHMFAQIGSTVSHDGATFTVQHRADVDNIAPEALPTGIRSAVLLFAPVLHKTGRFEFSQDAKGCALGVREIDPHLEVLEKFGCGVAYNGTSCVLTCPDGFIGADVWQDYQSVTATETFLMAAVMAKGKSRMINAACEPHVKYFCLFLNEMGAKITGLGTSILEVEGVDVLHGVDFRTPDDHHEAATYAAIGAATGGVLRVVTDIAPEMVLIVRQFQKIGLNIKITDTGLITGPSSFIVEKGFTPEIVTKVEAAPWPYFPADILPQIIGASIRCKGEILFWNKIYEGALFWTSELQKFGATAHLSDPHRLMIIGTQTLRPAVVEAPYIIRVVLGLLIAALQIDGESLVRNAEPISRAHPDFIEKLQGLGVRIAWIA